MMLQPQKQELKLLYYTHYFKRPLTEAIGFAPELAADLCTVFTDRERISEADAVVFHIPNVRDLPLPKKRGQLWVALSMESDANYPIQTDPSFLAHFDISITFKSSADIQSLYFHPEHLELLRTPAKKKSHQVPAVYLASNDYALNNRYELVEELMKYLPVDSYGKSQNNRQLHEDTGRMTKLEVISWYRFYLAFENSNVMDYVSEKMYDGLIAGTLPVYLGAPNIDDYLPGRNCIIKVSDFDTPAQLAAYLLTLNDDESAYQQYFAWKQEPFRQSFTDLVDLGRTPTIRRLCAEISKRIQLGHSKSSLSSAFTNNNA